MLEAGRRANAGAPAVLFKDETLTYDQLIDQVGRCASGLRSLGIKRGDRFALVMRNCPEFVILYFALLELGAVAVPANFVLKSDELAYIFKHAEVVGAAAQKVSLSNVAAAGGQTESFRHTITVDSRVPGATPFDKLLESEPTAGEEPRSADDTAMIIYTSGTTGRPKGVMLSHRNLASNVESCRKAIHVDCTDTFMCLLPMFHSFAWTTCVLLPLALGAKVVVMESVQPFGEVIRQIRKCRVSIFIAVPPVFAALARVPFWRPLRRVNPVRLCVSGAAALPAGVLEKFESKFGLPLLEGYGLTEASPVVSLNPLNRERKSGTIGIPLPDVEVKVMDGDGRELDHGLVGEICVRGSNVMAGYFRQPEETEQAFFPDGWLRTGDLGQIDHDGFIRVVDRLKDLIIVKGLNVYPREVEEVIESHPDVAEASVVGIPDDTGDELVKAFVTPRDGHKLDKSSISRFCRDRLAAYKCPREIAVVDELPKNAIGKVVKQELRGRGSSSEF